MFWFALYFYPAVWAFLTLVSVIRLNLGWLLLDGIALGLLGANLIGYIKCDKEARARLAANLGNSLVNGFLGDKLNAFLQ